MSRYWQPPNYSSVLVWRLWRQWHDKQPSHKPQQTLPEINATLIINLKSNIALIINHWRNVAERVAISQIISMGILNRRLAHKQLSRIITPGL